MQYVHITNQFLKVLKLRKKALHIKMSNEVHLIAEKHILIAANKTSCMWLHPLALTNITGSISASSKYLAYLKGSLS